MSAIKKRLITGALHGLAVIGDLIRKSPKGVEAEKLLTTIKRIIDGIEAAFSGDISPADLLKLIEESERELEAGIAANDRAALDAVDKKFPKT